MTMIIYDFRNPKYNQLGTIDCEIHLPDRDIWVPTTASSDDVEQEQVDLYNTIIASGTPIATYVPPTAEELRALLPNLTMRQFRLQLLADNLLPNVEAAIAALPSPQKEEAQIEWEYASMVERNNNFVKSLMPVLNLTDEQVDTMWQSAVAR